MGEVLRGLEALLYFCFHFPFGPEEFVCVTAASVGQAWTKADPTCNDGCITGSWMDGWMDERCR